MLEIEAGDLYFLLLCLQAYSTYKAYFHFWFPVYQYCTMFIQWGLLYKCKRNGTHLCVKLQLPVPFLQSLQLFLLRELRRFESRVRYHDITRVGSRAAWNDIHVTVPNSRGGCHVWVRTCHVIRLHALSWQHALNLPPELELGTGPKVRIRETEWKKVVLLIWLEAVPLLAH